jgi:hypothetical protein
MVAPKARCWQHSLKRAHGAAYAITDAELELAKDGAAIIREEVPDLNDPHRIKWRITRAVAEFCDCTIWRDCSGGLQFCGMVGDVEWAVWLLDHLTDFVAVELVKHPMTSLAPSSERSRIIKGFVLGCTDRISVRITELCEPPTDQSDNSKALIVIKTQAIADKLAQCGIRLRETWSRRHVL